MKIVVFVSPKMPSHHVGDKTSKSIKLLNKTLHHFKRIKLNVKDMKTPVENL